MEYGNFQYGNITDDVEGKTKSCAFSYTYTDLERLARVQVPFVQQNKLNLDRKRVCKIKLSPYVELSDHEYFVPDAIKS